MAPMGMQYMLNCSVIEVAEHTVNPFPPLSSIAS